MQMSQISHPTLALVCSIAVYDQELGLDRGNKG